MFGRPAESNGFAKYSRNPSGSGSRSGLGQNSTGVNNLFSSGSFGVQTSGSVFGGSAGGMNGEAKKVMHFKNVNSTANNVFGKDSSRTYSGLSPSLMFGAGGLGNGGSSASVVGVNQPKSFMPLKGSSKFTFGGEQLQTWMQRGIQLSEAHHRPLEVYKAVGSSTLIQSSL
ncbi:unnamed protein product [Rhodiola kirilowii]